MAEESKQPVWRPETIAVGMPVPGRVLPHLVAQGAPILLPVGGHVTDGHDPDQRVLSIRGHGWIEPGRLSRDDGAVLVENMHATNENL